jgi:hypothetical protein
VCKYKVVVAKLQVYFHAQINRIHIPIPISTHRNSYIQLHWVLSALSYNMNQIRSIMIHVREIEGWYVAVS